MFIEQFFNSLTDRYEPEYKHKTTEDGIILYLYFAGVKKSDISISINSSILKVEAKNKVGYSNWKYENSWRLGSGLDVERITSSYVDGVLAVNIPKVKEESSRKIPVD